MLEDALIRRGTSFTISLVTLMTLPSIWLGHLVGSTHLGKFTDTLL